MQLALLHFSLPTSDLVPSKSVHCPRKWIFNITLGEKVDIISGKIMPCSFTARKLLIEKHDCYKIVKVDRNHSRVKNYTCIKFITQNIDNNNSIILKEVFHYTCSNLKNSERWHRIVEEIEQVVESHRVKKTSVENTQVSFKHISTQKTRPRNLYT